jgi:hypothetical protein
VLRARALLASGRELDPADLHGVPPQLDPADLHGVPPQLELDRELLLGWQALRHRDAQGLMRMLRACARPPRHFYQVWRRQDLQNALLDERVDPGWLAGLLEKAPRAARRGPLGVALLCAKGRAGLLTQNDQRTIAKLVSRIDSLGRLNDSSADLGLALAGQLRAQGQVAAAHVLLLQVWASLNLGTYTNAREVRRAREQLIAGLSDHPKAARAFSGVAAIEDLWPPRARVPKSVRICEDTLR